MTKVRLIYIYMKVRPLICLLAAGRLAACCCCCCCSIVVLCCVCVESIKQNEMKFVSSFSSSFHHACSHRLSIEHRSLIHLPCLQFRTVCLQCLHPRRVFPCCLGCCCSVPWAGVLPMPAGSKVVVVMHIFLFPSSLHPSLHFTHSLILCLYLSFYEDVPNNAAALQIQGPKGWLPADVSDLKLTFSPPLEQGVDFSIWAEPSKHVMPAQFQIRHTPTLLHVLLKPGKRWVKKMSAHNSTQDLRLVRVRHGE